MLGTEGFHRNKCFGFYCDREVDSLVHFLIRIGNTVLTVLFGISQIRIFKNEGENICARGCIFIYLCQKRDLHTFPPTYVPYQLGI